MRRGRFDFQLLNFIIGGIYLHPERSGPARQTSYSVAPSVLHCLVTRSWTSGLFCSSTANSHFDNSGSSCPTMRFKTRKSPQKLECEGSQVCGKDITSSDLDSSRISPSGSATSYAGEMLPSPTSTSPMHPNVSPIIPPFSCLRNSGLFSQGFATAHLGSSDCGITSGIHLPHSYILRYKTQKAAGGFSLAPIRIKPSPPYFPVFLLSCSLFPL